jgi:hypothetical protein
MGPWLNLSFGGQTRVRGTKGKARTGSWSRCLSAGQSHMGIWEIPLRGHYALARVRQGRGGQADSRSALSVGKVSGTTRVGRDRAITRQQANARHLVTRRKVGCGTGGGRAGGGKIRPRAERQWVPEAAGTGRADRRGETPAERAVGGGARNGEGPRVETRRSGRGRRNADPSERGRATVSPPRGPRAIESQASQEHSAAQAARLKHPTRRAARGQEEAMLRRSRTRLRLQPETREGAPGAPGFLASLGMTECGERGGAGRPAHGRWGEPAARPASGGRATGSP